MGNKKKNSIPIPETNNAPICLEIGFGLIRLVDKDKGAELLDRIRKIRKDITEEMGLVIPLIRIVDNLLLSNNEYCIIIYGQTVGGNKLEPDSFCEQGNIIATHLKQVCTQHAADFISKDNTKNASHSSIS
jgi:flagellar biosynthesis component FlhA